MSAPPVTLPIRTDRGCGVVDVVDGVVAVCGGVVGVVVERVSGPGADLVGRDGAVCVVAGDGVEFDGREPDGVEPDGREPDGVDCGVRRKSALPRLVWAFGALDT